LTLTELKQSNRLLASLPTNEWARLEKHLELVDLAVSEVLYESGDPQRYVYFPTTAIVSLVFVIESGAGAEIAVVGNEGVVGICLFMGGESTPGRAVVQSAGQGLRMNAQAIKKAFERTPVLHLLLRYTQALLTQMAQNSVCNRHHALDQQICRWLLMNLDRRAGDELSMTQESIAYALGVRRESISEGASKLQAAGCIRYSRGRVRVLDRAALEARACECYKVVAAEYVRLLPASRAA
jgi:CRP-like cAMP-binding protein